MTKAEQRVADALEMFGYNEHPANICARLGITPDSLVETFRRQRVPIPDGFAQESYLYRQARKVKV